MYINIYITLIIIIENLNKCIPIMIIIIKINESNIIFQIVYSKSKDKI